jgi:Domain of unknown function (DUF3883)
VRPPDSVLRAARVWIGLLQRTSTAQSWALIRSSAAYEDLSRTQYIAGFEWLQSVGLIEDSSIGRQLSVELRGLSEEEVGIAVFERCLVAWAPAWLPDSDILIASEDDLPEDAIAVATALGLNERQATNAVRRVEGHIDLEGRARTGAAGERQLAECLEQRWPGCVDHVSLRHDGFGYDLRLVADGVPWHIEVKSTVRRGRLSIYVSRQEFEVSLVDPNWRLVVVGLTEAGVAQVAATLQRAALRERAPTDQRPGGRWQSARFDRTSQHLDPGLPFLFLRPEPGDIGGLLRGGDVDRAGFAWIPPERTAD